jgi:aminopeptidase N
VENSLTYSVVGQPEPVSRLMTAKTDILEDIVPNAALKLNVNGAGNYRVECDQPSWDILVASLGKLSVDDRVNLLSDAWALAQANRTPLSLYLGLVERLPSATELAEREQVISVVDYINRLFAGQPAREKFQRYARSILRPSFDALGWDPKPDEPVKLSNLRPSLILTLGDLNDPGIIAGCRDRFEKYLTAPTSVPPDLQRPVLLVVGRYADAATWEKLHELGLRTTNIAEKQNVYDALASAIDPTLAKKALQIALTEELPTSRATFLVGKVARDSDHPEVAWRFARENMKALLAKTDALSANRYAPSLFIFFSDPGRIDELKAFAKASLPPASAKEVAKAVDEIEFRSEFKQRLARQLNAWIEKR